MVQLLSIQISIRYCCFIIHFQCHDAYEVAEISQKILTQVNESVCPSSFWSLTIRTFSSNGNGCRSLTFYVEVNSDRKKQMALEFIWNSFIMIWSLIRKGGSSDGNGCRSLTSYVVV